jgi:hypothetical protein
MLFEKILSYNMSKGEFLRKAIAFYLTHLDSLKVNVVNPLLTNDNSQSEDNELDKSQKLKNGG